MTMFNYIKHTICYLWGRNRVPIALVRFCGLRATRLPCWLTMKQINLGIRKGWFQVFQPKTNRYRVVVLTKNGKFLLKEIDSHLQTVFGNDENKVCPLPCTPQSWVQVIVKNEWAWAINKFKLPPLRDPSANSLLRTTEFPCLCILCVRSITRSTGLATSCLCAKQ